MQDVHTTLPIGTIILERYRVEELLGKGGFGSVYRVTDQRVRGNVFALKELIDSSKKERTRFTFEGELLKRLDHSSLPRVYRSFDDDKNYRAYILMDYIEGLNLEELRQKQPEKRFMTAQAIPLMAPVFNAIGYLHHHQPPIIHRDVKPANIIVPPSGDQAVLVDFGIAKEYDTEATTTAIRRCSPGYGAPEQYASGTNPRTDIYGLGATIYALVTGQIPLDAVYRMTHLSSNHADPLDPVVELVPDIPRHVSDAIQRSMAIKSAERFVSVEEFWQALNAQSLEHGAPIAPVRSASTGKNRPIEDRETEVVATPAALLSLPQVATPAIPPTDTETTVKFPIPRRRGKTPFILFSVLLLLAALVAGLVFGFSTGTLPLVGHAAHGKPGNVSVPVTSKLHSTPGAQKTTIVQPTTIPTTQPTSLPTPVATTVPATSYPILSPVYDGQISDQFTNPATNASMTLSQIQQNGANINGTLTITGLLAGNTFSGTLGPQNAIQFTVPSYGTFLPLLFQGQIQPNGSISGSYCSYRNNLQCDRSAGGWGTWDVSPPPAQS